MGVDVRGGKKGPDELIGQSISAHVTAGLVAEGAREEGAEEGLSEGMVEAGEAVHVFGVGGDGGFEVCADQGGVRRGAGGEEEAWLERFGKTGEVGGGADVGVGPP